ncbi:MAG: endonuclease/exonuclease/phosphatase family protein [Lachnospiraceae bacterium]|nr:endonuclease/exonuclease/phosphatase family protein [Lachnospiraceae bacterium]
MRIATWNVERLKHRSELSAILGRCKESGPDILVLTETDTQIHPAYKNCYQTPPAKEVIPALYKDTENRVAIYTDYELVRCHETYDEHTAICAELKTEKGSLIVYGTIMGVFGNREKSYLPDLEKQMEDIKRLSALGAVCVTGDYNCSFSDNYYYTTEGRNIVTDAFHEAGIRILTEKQPECIDHIAISELFFAGADITVNEWNMDKSLSDHKGIVIEIETKR